MGCRLAEDGLPFAGIDGFRPQSWEKVRVSGMIRFECFLLTCMVGPGAGSRCRQSLAAALGISSY